MSTEKAVEYMITKDLSEMRKELYSSLSEKAVDHLQERKYHMAKEYFGQK